MNVIFAVLKFFLSNFITISFDISFQIFISYFSFLKCFIKNNITQIEINYQQSIFNIIYYIFKKKRES